MIYVLESLMRNVLFNCRSGLEYSGVIQADIRRFDGLPKNNQPKFRKLVISVLVVKLIISAIIIFMADRHVAV